MTLTLAVTPDNDLAVAANGSLAFLSGPAASLQLSIHAARVRRGECVLDVPRGVPFSDTAWAGVPDVPRFVAALRAQLLAVDGVTGIVSLTTRRAANTLRYTATLRTASGEVVTFNG